MPHEIPGPTASKAGKITHRGRPPERAALLLVGELGPAAALVVVSRELHEARKARSRSRFRFWAEVRDRLDRQPGAGARSEDATRPTAAP
jgi:hypothetical protein